jgi:peptidoglycan/xylan/chitin deacetylase (PgdA/CDA1 family)
MQRLAAADLPPRAVTLTFDDGFYNYYEVVAPVLAEFGFPATLYLTTYYVENQAPIFNLAADYLLWQHRLSGRRIGTELGLTEPATLDGPEVARRVSLRLVRAADALPGADRDALLARLAETLGVDYGAFCRSRLFHLMAPSEVRELATRPGLRFELHTHRHRAPHDEALFRREVRENRDRVAALTGAHPSHFCYPSGEYDPSFVPWLRDEGVRSATTCAAGLASPRDEMLRLPRLLDWLGLTEVEFEAWLCGSGHMVQQLAPSRSDVAARTAY